VGPDLGTIELILFSICEEGYCMLANSVCEECEYGVLYNGNSCIICDEEIYGFDLEEVIDVYDDEFDYVEEGGF
jgi:hypothetical protein